MKSYFLRRFLLIPPTLLGITFLIFSITRFVPGGPMDRILQETAGDAEGGGSKQSAAETSGGLNEDQLEELEEQYGLDKIIPIAYMQWLGAKPREAYISKGEFGKRGDGAIGEGADDQADVATVVLRGDGRVVMVRKSGPNFSSAVYKGTNQSILEDGWQVRVESIEDREARYLRRNPKLEPPSYVPRAVIFRTQFKGLLQGDLGRSQIYGDPVWEMIVERVPIALYFGLLTAFFTYAISLPLGVLKALKHRTFLDSGSSVLIFIGYSIPGFALGAILLVHLGARMGLFPLFGFTSPGFEDLGLWDQMKDLVHHTTLPLLCYLIGSFAMLTMMTKNNLMDQLAADYVRTAVAKGAGFKRAVFGHAFRNSMIPVATSAGSLIEIFIGGSILIETVFDIQGFGLLQYQAILTRDVPVIMGTLTIAAFLMLMGKVLSDLIVAMVDPRIQFK